MSERQEDQRTIERLRREHLERANAAKDNEVDEKVMPDMTEIDVPDWVVEVAMAAGEQFASENTVSMYATVRDLRREEMRTSITAALGAWAVPVAVSREHDASRPTFGDVVPNDSQEADMWAYALVPLYTLRQEKPE